VQDSRRREVRHFSAWLSSSDISFTAAGTSALGVKAAIFYTGRKKHTEDTMLESTPIKHAAYFAEGWHNVLILAASKVSGHPYSRIYITESYEGLA
jgi:hypothetical protein